MNQDTHQKFKDNNYVVIKKLISEEIANFSCLYLANKREACNYMNKTNKMNDEIKFFMGDFGDSMISDTFSIYGDMLMETLLAACLPGVEKITGLKLVPTYAYTRIYKKGDVLKRHKDRASCETSLTLNLGGDHWPIFLEPSGKKGEKGISIDLNAGDCLIYRGDLVEHWREEFKGEQCFQTFFHYNNKNGEFGESNLFDGRGALGVPR